MLASLKGGFFFFFGSCLVVMGVGVWFFIPETKGRSLERMDEIFGSAYGVVGEGRGVGSGNVSGNISEVVVGSGDGRGVVEKRRGGEESV